MDTPYIHEAPNIPLLLSITLRHLNGCPLIVGHPLFLGVSGSLTGQVIGGKLLIGQLAL